MSIAITDEHRALADSVSQLLTRRDARAASRALLEAPTEERPALWSDLVGLGLPGLHVPEDLGDAILAMSDCEFILIDTAGRSPTDALKLNELKGFLEAAHPDEVHLVAADQHRVAVVQLAHVDALAVDEDSVQAPVVECPHDPVLPVHEGVAA